MALRRRCALNDKTRRAGQRARPVDGGALCDACDRLHAAGRLAGRAGRSGAGRAAAVARLRPPGATAQRRRQRGVGGVLKGVRRVWSTRGTGRRGMWCPSGTLGTRRTYRPWLARRLLADGAGGHADAHRDRADATAGRCRDGIARRAGIPVPAYAVLPTSTVPTRRSPALAAHTSLVRCGASVTLMVAFQQRRLQHADAE